MKRHDKRVIVFGLFLWLGTMCTWATKPQRVVIDTYPEWAKGTSRSVTLSDQGTLEAAPQLEKVADVPVEQIWALLTQTDGSFIAGTSPEGKLMKITSGGESIMLTKFSETHIYALAKNKKGEIFVGTSPDGKIFRLDLKNKPEVYFEPNEKYIWSLAFDAKGNLFAATGTSGKIYKITGAGQGAVFYDSDETHIRSLAFDKDGTLLAGSADSGLLYRISGPGEGVVLASTGKQEVNRIVTGADGVIYFTATGGNQSGGAKPPTPATPNAALGGLKAFIMAAQSGDESKPPGTSAPGAAAQKSPGADSTSQLYRLDSSLFPQPIWNSREMALTLNPFGGRMLVGTADDGYFYSVNDRAQVKRVVRVESESITAVVPLAENQLAVATSNPARIYRLGGRRGEAGVYESDVIDSGLFARWGSIHTEGGGSAQIRTRSGNTPKPDKSWYGWTAVNGGQIKSPASRFLQFELRTIDGEIDRTEIVFLPRNLKPRIEQIQILAPGTAYVPIVPPPQPAQAKGVEQLVAPQSPQDAAGFTPPVRYQPIDGRGMRSIAWKAVDPNEDELRFTVSFRKDGTSEWRVIGKDLKEPVLSWDTSGWPDGNYYLKVEANDAADNAAGDELGDETISRLLVIDNTPPKILVNGQRGGTVTFTVSEEAGSLREVTVSTDGKNFKVARPVDDILDSRTEQFSIKVNSGDILFIRAEDEAGNVSGTMVPK